MAMDLDTPTGGPFLGSALAPKIASFEHSHSNPTMHPNAMKKSCTKGQQQTKWLLCQLLDQLPIHDLLYQSSV